MIKLDPFENFPPTDVCYNETSCDEFLPATRSWNNLICRRIDKLEGLESLTFDLTVDKLTNPIKDRFQAYSIVPHEIEYCNNTSIYQC